MEPGLLLLLLLLLLGLLAKSTASPSLC